MLLSQISGYSLIFAVLFSVILLRFRNRAFLPFLLLIWIGLFNEFLSYTLIFSGKANSINSNIYVLLESMLILWQFSRWNLFRNRLFFPVMSCIYITGWITENLIFGKLVNVCSFYQVGYSFVTVLMSIQMINELIVAEKRSLIKNAIFLICIGFVFYFTLKILVEIFWLYGLRDASRAFRAQIYRIMIYVNIFVNLIYALAVLWMPRNTAYTARS